MMTSPKITVGAIPVAGRTTSSLAGLHGGIVTNVSYTVAYAIEDWLANGLAGRAPKTASTQVAAYARAEVTDSEARLLTRSGIGQAAL